MKLKYTVQHYVNNEDESIDYMFVFHFDKTYAISHHRWYELQIEELTGEIREKLHGYDMIGWLCTRHFETLYVCIHDPKYAALFKLEYS